MIADKMQLDIFEIIKVSQQSHSALELFIQGQA